MALTRSEIDDIADDAENLRVALLKRGFRIDTVTRLTVAAMPAIVRAAVEDGR